MCWLDYEKMKKSNAKKYEEWLKEISFFGDFNGLKACKDELLNFIRKALSIEPNTYKNAFFKSQKGIVVLESSHLDKLNIDLNVEGLSEEGFIIKNIKAKSKDLIVIISKAKSGLIYAIFDFIKAIRLGKGLDNIDIVENPKNKLRMINHWDNMDGSIERGYAGRSIFYDNNKILVDSPRIKDYARLLSSIGINSVVLNNVNVKKKEVELITRPYLTKLAKIAKIFEQYGIRIFLSINFASPIYLGGLKTADPCDDSVSKWWEEKVEEIYSYIPQFGGFLVKADSEFNPGPYMYGRTHADGANMLAKPLSKYNGYVVWRCFVYNCTQDWRDTKTDRAKAAYDNFKPIDGSFADNVVLQIKNGPMDFQIREPVSPLFGALEKTNQVIEFQITQEYTGQQKHLCFLGKLWKEVLDFDTYAKGEGSYVKRIVDGSLFGNKIGGFAAVSNVGNDYNWTGHDLAQANLYAYGELAWNPDKEISKIVDEWIRLTFGSDKTVLENVSFMLLNSREIYEKYTTPLGLGWMVNPGHHYGPNPEGYEYSHWGTYHRSSHYAIGVDRTSKGTGYTAQYSKHWQEIYDDVEKCPEELILFFHRLPWTHKLKSGKTLIQYMYDSHFEGVEEVENLIEKWQALKGKVKKDVYERVMQRLQMQLEHAKEWRDVINTHFYRKTGIKDQKGRKIFE